MMASWKPQSDFYIELISILALQLALMMFFLSLSLFVWKSTV